MTEQEGRNQKHVQSFFDSLEAGKDYEVRLLLQSLHPAEVADVLESLPAEARSDLWEYVDVSQQGAVLAGTHSTVRIDLLKKMDAADVADVTSQLESDDVADILQDLPNA